MKQEFLCLNECKIGKEYKIYEVSSSLLLKNKIRLLEFGFIKGRTVKLLRKSMLKKTLLVELMGGVLSLRFDIAQFVAVTT